MKKHDTEDRLKQWKGIAGIAMIVIGLYATQNPNQFIWIGNAVVGFAKGVAGS